MRFDLERLQVLSDPVTVVDDVAMTITGAAHYAFSRTGTLVYVPSRQMARSLVWVDRKGQEAPIPAPARAYIEPRLSPDGSRIAVAIADQDHDIWLWDLTRGGPLTRLTIDPSIDQNPIWTLDGQRIVFASRRASAQNLWVQAADGTGAAERLTTAPDWQSPASVLPDETGIIGTEISPHTAGDIVWFKRAANPSAQGTSPGSGPLLVERLVHTNAIEHGPRVAGRALHRLRSAARRDCCTAVPADRRRVVAGVTGWRLATSMGAERTGAVLPRPGTQAHGGARADVAAQRSCIEVP